MTRDTGVERERRTQCNLLTNGASTWRNSEHNTEGGDHATHAMSALAQDGGYSFQTINFQGDTFIQLLGISSSGTIAGYHGADPNNRGFVLTLPNTFTARAARTCPARGARSGSRRAAALRTGPLLR